MQFKFRRLWQLVGILLVASIVTLSLMHKPPAVLPPIKFGDKFGHMIAYLVLMGWYVQLFHVRIQRWILMLTFIGMGVGIEFLQGLGGVRYFEWADALANTTGVVLAYLLANTGFQYWLYRFEKRFLARS